MNYLLFYERVEQALKEKSPSEEKTAANDPNGMPGLAAQLSRWIAADGYLQPGLTIRELSETLQTNCTYLLGYIKATYNLLFRD